MRYSIRTNLNQHSRFRIHQYYNCTRREDNSSTNVLTRVLPLLSHTANVFLMPRVGPPHIIRARTILEVCDKCNRTPRRLWVFVTVFLEFGRPFISRMASKCLDREAFTRQRTSERLSFVSSLVAPVSRRRPSRVLPRAKIPTSFNFIGSNGYRRLSRHSTSKSSNF